MVSCSIPNKHRLNFGSQGPRELLQELIDDRRIEVRSDDGFGLTRLRASSANHIDVGVLRLADGPGPGTLRRPNPCQRSLLAKPCFILKEDLQLSIGMRLLNFLQLLRELFLKAS